MIYEILNAKIDTHVKKLYRFMFENYLIYNMDKLLPKFSPKMVKLAPDWPTLMRSQIPNQVLKKTVSLRLFVAAKTYINRNVTCVDRTLTKKKFR